MLAAASQGMAGNLYDWGGDGTGALGDGTIPATTQYNYPVNPGVGTVISASDGAYASEIVGSGGQVYVAGQNTAGVIGEGSASTTDYVTYQPVYTSSTNTTFTNAIQVSGGSDNTLSADFALALRADGTVWAWGSNSQGQLGNNTTTNEYYPVEVLAGACSTCGTYLDHIVAIQAGMYFAIALRADGTVWAWGYGGFDSLGDGSTTSHLTPVEVCAVGTCTTPLSGVTQIATHEEAALALVNGTVVSWGYNINGALGNGTTTSSSLPVHVCAPGTSSGCTSYLSNIKNISMGYQTGYALSDSGNVYGWGGYVDGDLGNGNTCSPSHGNTDCTSAQYEVPTEIPAGADSACGGRELRNDKQFN